MRSPSFYVIGAQKTGTTSLHHYLSAHPDLYLPEKKETKFFVIDERYAKGFDSYLQDNFSSSLGHALLGEVDPDYMYFDSALVRMAEHLDLTAIKFVVVLRNPVDRAFSHYLMTYRRGLESLSFEEAISVEAKRLSDVNSQYSSFYSNMHFSYMARGYYYQQISRFLQYVDKSQFYFILSEELKSETRKCLTGLYDFLGVSTNISIDGADDHYHQATIPRSLWLVKWLDDKRSPTKDALKVLLPTTILRGKLRSALLGINQRATGLPTMNINTRKSLLELYRDDIKNMADLSGLNLDEWYRV